jgi:two-component sensor histidine kinase
VGIPETFSIETAESLGLQIVNVLVEQLDGSVRLNRDRGTEYVIEFTSEECGE